MTQNTESKYSLVKPNFSGLWSVSWIGGRYNEKQKTNRLNDAVSIIAVLVLTFSWVVGFVSPLIIALLCYYRFYTLCICILSVLLYPYIFAYRIEAWPAICRFYIKYGCNYFEGGCSMIYEEATNDPSLPLSERVPSINSYHPHGIFTLGLVYNSGIRLRATSDQSMAIRQIYCGDVYGRDELAKNSNLDDTKIPYFAIIDSKLHKAPVFNHVCVKWTGCMQPATAKNVKNIMKKKQSYGVMTGGFYEAGLFENGKELIYIKKKKGFIKYALKFGYRIVPAYTFGESRTYSNLMSRLSNKYKLFRRITKWLCDYNIPACIFYSDYWFICPLLPNRSGVGIHTIHGKAIAVPQIDDPTQEDIDKYHNIYLQSIQSLFDRNKSRFGMDTFELIVY